MDVYRRSLQPRPWVKAVLVKPKVIVKNVLLASQLLFLLHVFYEEFTVVFTSLGEGGTGGQEISQLFLNFTL